jgi:UDP-N-acetylglucosamine 2-epimerase
MVDAITQNRELASRKSRALENHGLEDAAFGLVTVHRPVNTTGPALANLLQTLAEIAAKELPLIFPVHPRTRVVLKQLNYIPAANLRLIDPLPYLDIVTLVNAAAVLITDSGGMQKEAAFLETPCVTMRDETEWTETIDMGVNTLVGDGGARLSAAISEIKNRESPFTESVRERIREHYGTGHAAKTIVDDCINLIV